MSDIVKTSPNAIKEKKKKSQKTSKLSVCKLILFTLYSKKT